jgi:hypothetical protein
MNWKLLKTLLPCLLLTSCANLQQAPLIYSSKSSVGLDISSSTTESPGGSISFGVKLVDAAYVPVAVSKRTGAKENDDDNKQIDMVQAVFGEGVTRGKLDGLTEENKLKIRAYLDAKLREEEIRTKISVIKQKKEKLMAEIRSNDRKISELLGIISSAQAGVDTAIQNQEIEKYKAENFSKNKEAVELVTDLLDTQLKAAADESTKLFDEASEAASFLRTDKRDAMSVYGRFNSESKAGIASTTGELTAGKIFSTGVASQNLTEAARYSAIYQGVAECVAKMTTVYSAAPVEGKPKVLEMIGKMCDPELLRKLDSNK